jgi:hypothetical protein
MLIRVHCRIAGMAGRRDWACKRVNARPMAIVDWTRIDYRLSIWTYCGDVDGSNPPLTGDNCNRASVKCGILPPPTVLLKPLPHHCLPYFPSLLLMRSAEVRYNNSACTYNYHRASSNPIWPWNLSYSSNIYEISNKILMYEAKNIFRFINFFLWMWYGKKISLQQTVDAHRVVRCWGSHNF